MKKYVAIAALWGALIVGGALTVFSTPVQGATAWTWVKTKNYPNLAYHTKDATQTVYMWDLNHTQKIHNLKNYPKTTWYLSQSVKLQLGKKAGIYYLVRNNTDKVAGLVHRKYLTKGDNPKDKLASDPAVKSYGGGFTGIQSTREAKNLQRKILTLFPGTVLNAELSEHARTDLNADPDAGRSYSTTNSNAAVTGIFSPYNWIKTTSKTNYLKLVTKVLEDQGYNAEKRQTYKGYQIGIYATPHGYAGDYTMWISGYGSFGIYLMPAKNKSVGYVNSVAVK